MEHLNLNISPTVLTTRLLQKTQQHSFNISLKNTFQDYQIQKSAPFYLVILSIVITLSRFTATFPGPGCMPKFPFLLTKKMFFAHAPLFLIAGANKSSNILTYFQSLLLLPSILHLQNKFRPSLHTALALTMNGFFLDPLPIPGSMYAPKKLFYVFTLLHTKQSPTTSTKHHQQTAHQVCTRNSIKP